MSNKIPVGVLAATGSVGQRFIQLLDNHPWFEVTMLSGSDRTQGQTYGEGCNWLLADPMPEWASKLPVLPTNPDAITTPLVFSALPADIAKDVEPAFAKAGAVVCSNASAYRREMDVPILLPEVNANHAELIHVQRTKRGWKGAIITNPNCTSTGLTVALKALKDAFGLKRIITVSMQAISGAGYPGVPSLDILDNVIPYIGDEENKVEYETRKMLGSIKSGGIAMADFGISAHTNRVSVVDGHTVVFSVELENKATPEEAIQVLKTYQGPEISRDLPSAPRPVIAVRDENNRPQPRLDRMTGKGMTTVVGRVRPDPVFDLKMVTLSHNTIRGAAGGSIFNAELLVRLNLLA
jgi:aspartate-semialdehyde dehydrogenase